ncbi:hypothetical protein LX64_01919 [Chitinophaga skermanii]|uniref:Choice-of-anchor I domain-containing protein n=1 Tax=Chitinophaga skermanii TaxID=331697 RepID=A0A327QSX0_9BACT|nr:choice-of-anchor I family protein [Chitinophaga skermanii]RAJ06792.1 hypothetical protein LX64_01919 [Chitinophaga skermanii]
MRIKHLLPLLAIPVYMSCTKNDDKPTTPEFFVNEDPSTFAEIGSINIGGAGAAEISAYDSLTKRLFVVNNSGVNRIEVVDFSNPTTMKVIGNIDVSTYGAVNSLSVYGGMLAAAIEGKDKTMNGKVVVYDTKSYAEIKAITVGALPDMVTFSANGKYIMSANEGEPSQDYKVDPVGSVSIIDVKNSFAVTTLDFSSFAGQAATLKSQGGRVFGPNASFAQDMEPEYITIAPDEKTAWVTLQENNMIAKIDLAAKTVTNMWPLGFKDYSLAINAIDPSDKDGIKQRTVPVKGMYQPDAIAMLIDNGIPYLFTANEGDVREWDAYAEAKRVKDITLDPTKFPNAATLKTETELGRLNITTTLGNTDGVYTELYSFGARSFSVWNGNDGKLVFDSNNELENKCIEAKVYDDGRSDDKGVEPEGIATGKVGKKNVVFVGMERSDAIAVYDATTPTKPVFLQLLKSGDAPEGVLFIPAVMSPTKKSLLVVSSENDGVVKVYTPNTL